MSTGIKGESRVGLMEKNNNNNNKYPSSILSIDVAQRARSGIHRVPNGNIPQTVTGDRGIKLREAGKNMRNYNSKPKVG